eukprot:362856-Chlamydomonas_euryale.AAC.2
MCAYVSASVREWCVGGKPRTQGGMGDAAAEKCAGHSMGRAAVMEVCAAPCMRTQAGVEAAVTHRLVRNMSRSSCQMSAFARVSQVGEIAQAAPPHEMGLRPSLQPAVVSWLRAGESAS